MKLENLVKIILRKGVERTTYHIWKDVCSVSWMGHWYPLIKIYTTLHSMERRDIIYYERRWINGRTQYIWKLK